MLGSYWIDKRLSAEFKDRVARWSRRVVFWCFIGLGALLAARSFWTYWSGLTALMIGSVFLLWGICRIVKRLWRRNARIYDLGLIAYGIIVTTVASAGTIRFVDTHEANFAPLIVALEEYNADQDQYPEHLAELIPEYLASLPECPMTLSSSPDTFYAPSEHGYHMECMIGAGLPFPYRGWYRPSEGEWFYYE